MNDTDVELGLLHRTSLASATHEDESEHPLSLNPAPNPESHRQNVHEVIGEAPVLFSRLLRAHD